MRPFAQHYDAIFADKTYDFDIAAFKAAFAIDSGADLRLLEIGSGTANHTLRLAASFREVVSIEIDADFVEIGRAKLSDGPRNVILHSVPVEALAETHFDAAVAFFHVLNYIPAGGRASFAAATASRLNRGGFFFADLWHAEAVALDPPREEKRTKRFGGMLFHQVIRPTYRRSSGEIRLEYDFRIEHDSGGYEEFQETIELSLWPRPSLERVFSEAGLGQIEFLDYRNPQILANNQSWRIWIKARKG